MRLRSCLSACYASSFKLPSHLSLENLPDLEIMDRELKAAGKGSSIAQMGSWHDSSLTWDFVPWIRQHTKLPIFMKVGTPER